MKTGIRTKIGIFSLLLCLLLSGCSKDRDNIGTEGSQSSGTDNSESGGAVAADSYSLAEVPELYLRERKNIYFYEPEDGWRVYDRFYETMKGKIYLLRVEEPLSKADDAPNGQRICVQTYDTSTQVLEQYILEPKLPEEIVEYTIDSAGLTDAGEVSLKLCDRSGKGNPYFLAKMDLQGNMLETVIPFPDEKGYPWNTDPFSGDRVYHLEDGRTILGVWNDTSGTGILYWFDSENGQTGQEIGRLEEGLPSAVSLDAEGLLYCVMYDDLFRWNPEKNGMDVLFQLQSNRVPLGAENGLFISEEGELLLYCMKNDEIRLNVLTGREPVSPEGTIRVVCVQDVGADFVKSMASGYSTEPGNMPVIIEKSKRDEDPEDYRNRIFAELTAGEGPDVMLLCEEDIKLLTEKGCLLDMSDMISEGMKARMIPAVLELCTIDGKMTAFIPKVEFKTMLTTDKVWEGESWTLPEFVELAESREDWERLIIDRSSDLSPLSLFFWLFFMDVEDSPLLDPEQFASYLDSDLFIRIMELCKKYGVRDMKLERSEELAMLKEGKTAAYMYTVYNMVVFSQDMSILGKNCHVVGVPAETGTGTVVRPYSSIYIAVNAKTEHREEIKSFINYLLDDEQQYDIGTSGVSVRMDIIRDSVFRDDNGIYRMRISSGGDGAILDLKPDGTPWIEEFLDLVGKSKPSHYMPKELRNIMLEELQIYFAGDKGAEETIGNIKRRLQIYYDEKR